MKKLILLCLLAVFLSNMGNQARAEDEWSGEDKILHVALGFGVSICSYGFYKDYFVERETWGIKLTSKEAVLLSIATSISVNILKEGFDMATGGDASWKDFVAGTAGNLIGYAILIKFDGDFKNWTIK